ncbi:MAG: Asp-tRNA(Asn)/Glu-tRNA(Gln) amidotransferase GatCAB subunit A, partial [Ramlibacter sp.]|nr:Asp-tRNA(Asn)/Glu-tRNA(Gln) amidotransferase GatCAB subunit A [Ramlibacter sp.]
MSGELHDLTVAELARALCSRQTSAVEVAEHFTARLMEKEQRAGGLGAFLATNLEATRAQ